MERDLGFHTELGITSILCCMISNGCFSGGNCVGFSFRKSLGNSPIGSYITKFDNALLRIESGPILLEDSMLSLLESFFSISHSSTDM